MLSSCSCGATPTRPYAIAMILVPLFSIAMFSHRAVDALREVAPCPSPDLAKRLRRCFND
eukprot:6857350-Lingulodinium_polyedra.AAC.1